MQITRSLTCIGRCTWKYNHGDAISTGETHHISTKLVFQICLYVHTTPSCIWQSSWIVMVGISTLEFFRLWNNRTPPPPCRYFHVSSPWKDHVVINAYCGHIWFRCGRRVTEIKQKNKKLHLGDDCQKIFKPKFDLKF